MSRLYDRYKTEVVPELQSELGIRTGWPSAPGEDRPEHGGRRRHPNIKLLDTARAELGLIAGQLPSSAGPEIDLRFKLRKGRPSPAYVTLRSRRMYEFFDRLVNIVLPRVRDFKAFRQVVRRPGNYTLGMREQLVFPEIDYTKVERSRGMNITIVTSARNDQEAFALLKKLGMPFREA